MPRPVPLRERFERHVERTETCWNWIGCVHSTGYGSFKVGRQVESAHRVAWLLNRGAIPDGLCVLHHCDNRRCVNSDHLFLGTQLENAQDREEKGRGVYLAGETNGYSRFKDEEVEEMRRLYWLGVSSTLVGRMFRTSRTTVHRMAQQRAWQHLPATDKPSQRDCKRYGNRYSPRRLTPEDVAQIRMQVVTGATYVELAPAFGVAPQTILAAALGYTHKAVRAPHARPRGTARGEKQGSSKLTESAIREIRTLHPAVSQKELAIRFGVRQATISRILLRQAWAHVP